LIKNVTKNLSDIMPSFHFRQSIQMFNITYYDKLIQLVT